VIGSFKTFLVEEESTIYFTFGRMNPPTIGHEKLLNALATKAGKNPYRIFLSPSHDKDKNPLDYKTKIKFARKAFPKYARSIVMSPTTRNVMEVASAIYKEGFKNVVMVVGSDRIREFEVRLNAVNGKKGRHGFFNFRKITVISAGDRDPESDSVTGMSASKMRAAVSAGDFSKFAQGLPKSVGNAEAKKIYNSIRSGMGLSEQKEFKNRVQLKPVSDLRESYVDGTLFEKGETVAIKENGVIGQIKYLGANYIILESKGGTYRKWLHQVEKVDPTETVTLADLEEKKNAEDPDIGDRKGSQPVNYHAGLKKSTKIARDRQFKKQAKMSDDNPAAYKPAPGDKTAKTRPSKYTLKFKQMFGDDVNHKQLAKKRIDREKAADKVKHDRMLDRARLQAAQKKNRETK
jgi:hypothetical protein